MGERTAAGEPVPPAEDEIEDSVSLLDLALPLIESWKLWILGSLAVRAGGAGHRLRS